MRLFLITLTILLLTPYGAIAHGGGTDKNGCHKNSKTGERHCHGKKVKPKPRQSTGGVYYANCTDARASGTTPIKRGEPGYASHLDRDNDGIACE